MSFKPGQAGLRAGSAPCTGNILSIDLLHRFLSRVIGADTHYGPQTEHNAKLSFHDWIKIRRLAPTHRVTLTHGIVILSEGEEIKFWITFTK